MTSNSASFHLETKEPTSRRPPKLLSLLAGASLFLAPLQAFAQQPSNTSPDILPMSLQRPFGAVFHSQDRAEHGRRIRKDELIPIPSKIETKEQSGANLILSQKCVSEIGSNANLWIDQNQLNELELSIERGKLVIAAREWFGRIRTKIAQIGIRGTVLSISVRPTDSQTTVEVFEGSASIRAIAFPDDLIIVQAGFRSIVIPGRRPTSASPIDTLDWTLFAVNRPPTMLLPQEDPQLPKDDFLPQPVVVRSAIH